MKSKKMKSKKIVRKNIKKAKPARKILVVKKKIAKIVKKIQKKDIKIKIKKFKNKIRDKKTVVKFAGGPHKQVQHKKIAVKAKRNFSLKKIRNITTKKINKNNTEIVGFPAEALFKARIKVVGIGGGGGSIVSEIGKSLEKATFVVADTDIRALKKKNGIKYFLFGQEVTRGLGTGANPDLARQAALTEKEKIEKLFKDQDIVILIASLGGGLGSGATEVFAKMASSFGAITLGIFTLPFKFEGKNKARIASKALKELRENLNVSITIPNERIFKIIDQNTPITQAFSVVNKNLIDSLESLIDLIYNPGLINIDFADLRTILRGKGSLAFLNTIEESGKNRAEEIAKKILINPLYQNNNFITEKILFNISGPANMSMFEVEKISRGISGVNPKAKIIFGISKNLKTKNKIKTTLLMTGSGTEKEIKLEKEPAVVNIKEEIIIKEPDKKAILPENKITKVNIEQSKAKDFKLTEPSENKNDNKGKKPIIKLETVSSLDKKLSIVHVPDKPAKKAIRRSALDIKKAEEVEENKRLAQEEEWEIPAFLRRVKYKS